MPVQAQSSQQIRIIDPILSTVAQGYVNGDFVGMNLFPRVPVMVAGGQILEFGKESFKLYNTTRSPGSNTKRISFGYLGKPYALLNKGLEVPVPREYLRDAAVVPGIDLATRAVNLNMRVLTLEMEVEQATLATTAGNYDSNHKVALTGTAKWSDSTCDVVAAVDTYREAVRSSVGIYPNIGLLSAQAFNAAKNNPRLRDQFKYTDSMTVTPEMLARAFSLDRVVVGRGVTSDDAGNLSDIWGNNAIFAYCPTTPTTMEEPSYGYTYTMEGHPLVEQPYYDNNAKSWIYGLGYERVAVLSGITSGFLVQNPA